MEWEDINWEYEVWGIPAVKMKIKQQYIVPLLKGCAVGVVTFLGEEDAS